jgi:NADH-quinone oxidoreductase subunit H
MSAVQRRRGPNVAGVFGLLQGAADGVKLIIKETVIPSSSNVIIFILSPIFTFIVALMG